MRMRVLTLLAICIALLAGCSSASGPSGPIALEQVTALRAEIGSQARAAARAFIVAYADSAADDGLSLSRLVGTREMSEWVRWLSVQNGQFAGAIRGHADITAIRFDEVSDVGGVRTATLDVQATVTFEYEPADGDAFEVTRAFDGPMTIARDADPVWLVVDATRDGVLFSDRIAVLDALEQRSGSLTVSIASTFAFAPSAQFNVIVRNDGDVAAAVDAAATSLRAPSGTGASVVTPGLLSIAPGTTVVGIVAVPLEYVVDGQGDLVITLDVGGRPVRFSFALPDLLGRSGGASPTAAPSPSTA